MYLPFGLAAGFSNKSSLPEMCHRNGEFPAKHAGNVAPPPTVLLRARVLAPVRHLELLRSPPRMIGSESIAVITTSERTRTQEQVLCAKSPGLQIWPLVAFRSSSGFIQIFTAQVGLTPKLYGRVRRFQRVRELVRNAREPDWAALGADADVWPRYELQQ
jgi:hypothetical protein